MNNENAILDSRSVLAKPPADEHQAIARHIATEFIRLALGEGETEVIGNKPRSVFFLGSLAQELFDDRVEGGNDTTVAPDDADRLVLEQDDTLLEFTPSEAASVEADDTDDVDSGALHMGERRVAPPSCGLRFHLTELAGEFNAKVRFSVWARARPLPSQFSDMLGREIRPSEMPSRFVSLGTVEVAGTLRLGSLQQDAALLSTGINERLDEIAHRFETTTECYRVPATRLSVPQRVEDVAAWLDAYDGQRFRPTWRAELHQKIRLMQDRRLAVDLRILNRTRVALTESKSREGTLFNATLAVDTNGAPSILRLRPTHFLSSDPRRAPVQTLAMGLACVAEELDGQKGTVATVHVPVHGQNPVEQDDRPGTRIRELVKDPAKNARAFLEALRASRGDWERMLAVVEKDGNAAAVKTARADLAAYEVELIEMARTVQMLERDDEEGRRVQRAFRLTMEAVARTFETKSKGEEVPRWRAFQLGFILAAIPRVIDRAAFARPSSGRPMDYESHADLIWFRTGGGKTEAFQALAIFNAFHDRLRGKHEGVTAWLRFALRALTVQQTQRLVDLAYHAERVRKTAHELDKGVPILGKPFGVGFLVGGAYTPSEVKPPNPKAPPEHQRENTSTAIAEQIRENPKAFVFVQRCPGCGKSTVESSWNQAEWNIVFTCSNPECDVGRLLLDVIDDSLRRNPPSFLVGTIDKIAGVGLTRKFQNFIRSPPWRCPRHGFVRPDFSKRGGGRCGLRCPDPCNEEVGRFVSKHDWAPGLVIIDEVHLLEEELGAFTGQYESILQQVTLAGDDPQPYYVLASATVAGWERHVAHLTGVEGPAARRFPSAPPTEITSFYYRLDQERIQRYFLGLHPHGKTENDAMIHTLRILHSILQQLYRDRPAMERLLGRPVTPDQQARLILPYARTICYVLALRQADGLQHSIDVQLRSYMENNGYEPVIASDTISSRMPSHALAELLNRLEEATIRQDDDPDVVPASSSIAYGIDIANINAMILMGQPRRTSEDIQVTSRTGRKFTGIVFRLFHPVRQRDLVHYLHFHNYHRNQDLLVDEVAVNRFATRTPARTMGGAIMGLIFSTAEDRAGASNPGWFLLNAKAIMNEPGRRQWFEEVLGRVYKTGHAQASDAFRQAVAAQIEINLNLISRAVHDHPQGTPGALASRPMTSLRDVDEGIDILAHEGRDSRSGIIADAGLKDRTMQRSRVQVIFNHAPEQTYEFGNVRAIVKTLFIDRAFDQGDVDKINRVVMATRLLPELRRAPELQNLVFAPDAADRLANSLEPVRPGRVKCVVFPLTLRCRRCKHTWQLNRTSANMRCPRDQDHGVGDQLRHMAVHDCGEAYSLWVPDCPNGHGGALMHLDDRPQEVSRWTWHCGVLTAGRKCTWSRRVIQRCFRCNPSGGGG